MTCIPQDKTVWLAVDVMEVFLALTLTENYHNAGMERFFVLQLSFIYSPI